ncbi:hypothetical protein SNEBB_004927 [Seison nebaliae]|nr:hypothetical protein SNEBB_004927 [Seison nebaliae]
MEDEFEEIIDDLILLLKNEKNFRNITNQSYNESLMRWIIKEINNNFLEKIEKIEKDEEIVNYMNSSIDCESMLKEKLTREMKLKLFEFLKQNYNLALIGVHNFPKYQIIAKSTNVDVSSKQFTNNKIIDAFYGGSDYHSFNDIKCSLSYNAKEEVNDEKSRRIIINLHHSSGVHSKLMKTKLSMNWSSFLVVYKKLDNQMEDKKKCLKRIPTIFASNTSIHGFTFRLESTTKKRKLFWSFVILIGIVVMFYFATIDFIEYHYTKPTITSSSKMYMHNLDFPAVSICKYQQLSKKELTERREVKYLMDYYKMLFRLNNTRHATYNDQVGMLENCFIESNYTYGEISRYAVLYTTMSLCAEDIDDMLYKKRLLVVEYWRLKRSKFYYRYSNNTRQLTQKFRTCLDTRLDELWPFNLNISEIVWDVLDNGIRNVKCSKMIVKYVTERNPIPLMDLPENGVQILVPKMLVHEIYLTVLHLFKIIALKRMISIRTNEIAKQTKMHKIMPEISWDIKQNIIQCHFSGNECDLNLFKRRFAEAEICYTFNWNDTTTLNQNLPGKNGGLIIGLDLKSFDTYEESYVFDPFKGVKVVIHNQSDAIASNFRGIPLQSGRFSYIKLNRENTKLLDASDGGNCQEDYLLPLYGSYSSFSCQSNCYFERVENNCGCIAYTDPRMENSSINKPDYCSSLDSHICLSKMKNLKPTENDFVNTKTCKMCSAPSCIEWRYSPQVTAIDLDYNVISYYTTSEEIDCLNEKNASVVLPFNVDFWQPNLTLLKRHSDVCLTRYNWRNSILYFSVYYDELATLTTIQKPKRNIFDFLGALGGTMGLYTGMSIISLIEIIEFISVYIFTVCTILAMKRKVSSSDKIN